MAELTAVYLTGASIPYQRLRRALELSPRQPGVFAPTELKVTQRGAGADKSVDVSAGPVAIYGADTARQGLYIGEWDAVQNVAISDNASGNPRIDSIVARMYDAQVIGGGVNGARVEVLQGTPTAGAQASNPAAANYRAGAHVDAQTSYATGGESLVVFADIEVADGFASITDANIVDRRPNARGAFRRIRRANTGNLTRTLQALAAVDATNLAPTLECSGVPVVVRLLCTRQYSSADSNYVFDLAVDGTLQNDRRDEHVSVANGRHGGALEWEITPAAGLHEFAPFSGTSLDAQTLTVLSDTLHSVTLVVAERVTHDFG